MDYPNYDGIIFNGMVDYNATFLLMIIKIPFKTPTVNHLYWHKGNIKIMKTEAKKLREHIHSIIDELDNDLPNCMPLAVTVWVYENWLTKKGTIARKDVMNRSKFLMDSVFEALAIDDKYIYTHSIIKKQSTTEEKAIVHIQVL